MERKFTLIELLVVLAVIGILASLLMPSLTKARLLAQAAVCNSNVRQVSVALMNYSSSHDGVWPYGPPVEPSQLSGNRPPGGGESPMELLYKFAGESVEVFTCPLDENPNDYKWWYFTKHTYFTGANKKASYMFNTRAVWAFAKQYDRQLRYADLQDPAEWPQMSDGNVLVSSNVWSRCNPANAGGWGVVDWWHNDFKVSLLMGDGHIKNIKGAAIEQYDVRE